MTEVTHHWRGFFNTGGGFLGICMTAVIGAISWRGGCSSANSMHVIPKDQISHCLKDCHKLKHLSQKKKERQPTFSS